MKSIFARLRKNAVIDTLCTLEGNAKPCLYLEPLWGIPYNLYTPFVSVYMAALGMSPTQIGLISTIFLASQMVWALLSGVLTDKLGRRLCTAIFDCISWSVPALLWMLAQDFRWFVVAALFNGAWRVTETSWDLLMIEDAPESKLVHMYTISSIAGLLAGFVAPLAYFFVQRLTIVPAVRIIYGFTFLMMTSKFIILYFLTKETSVGKRRMAETKNVGLFTRLWDSRKVLVRMLHSRRILLTVAFIACYSGICNINNAFWPLLITEKLGIPTENLSIFFTFKTLFMLVCYFVIAPKLDVRYFRSPVVLALGLLIAQQVLMLLMPTGAFWLVVVAVILEALALSVLGPMCGSLQMINIDREERARMLGFFYAMCMLFTSPLGSLAGIAAEADRANPFWMNLVLTLIAITLALVLWRERRTDLLEEAN
ncbi:MAG: MFS transporter [Clostridiales bacterium]|nr:MFS transporter [Clostridiales bacterium]